MKLLPAIILFIIMAIQGCRQLQPGLHPEKNLEDLINTGNFSRVEVSADSIKSGLKETDPLFRKIDSLQQIAGRIRIDFNLSENKADSLIKIKIGQVSLQEKQTWERKGWLEYRMIDGEKKYFNRAVSNLKLRLNQVHDSLHPDSIQPDSFSKFKLYHTSTILKQIGKSGQPVSPVNMTITYQLTVNADAVPDGETIRCWIPWPKENHSRQNNVSLIKTWPEKYYIAPDSCGQRSIYFEQKAKAGQPAIFKIQFSYSSYAQHFDLNNRKIIPCNTASALYKKYTAEQPPHIIFAGDIKSLADRICGSSQSPVEIVRKIYYWIDQNIIWSGALEYSIMPNIPSYALANRKGDCGMQTLLFMTLARFKGIPVKWQSGWMMHPGEVNLHDWCEVYYEGTGWVPLDMSFGLQNSTNQSVREFYLSGIDSYRLIVNDEISSTFNPAKQHLRSEPVDFQRGEVEWEGGNLYFDQWNYDMEVNYK